jgi:integrase
MPALQLKDIHRWWFDLRQRDGTGAKALKLLVLTGARSGEVRGMTWEEIQIFDQEEADERGYVGIWTIPAHRMKAKREHRVPLTHGIFEIIRGDNQRHGLVFPSSKNTTISDMTMSALMKRMHQSDKIGFVDAKSQKPAVPHGVRSTFRDWVAENNQSREAAELQLAHKFGTAVEHAYYRSDLIDLRAKLLDNWLQFLNQ